MRQYHHTERDMELSCACIIARIAADTSFHDDHRDREIESITRIHSHTYTPSACDSVTEIQREPEESYTEINHLLLISSDVHHLTLSRIHSLRIRHSAQ